MVLSVLLVCAMAGSMGLTAATECTDHPMTVGIREDVAYGADAENRQNLRFILCRRQVLAADCRMEGLRSRRRARTQHTNNTNNTNTAPTPTPTTTTSPTPYPTYAYYQAALHRHAPRRRRDEAGRHDRALRDAEFEREPRQGRARLRPLEGGLEEVRARRGRAVPARRDEADAGRHGWEGD